MLRQHPQVQVRAREAECHQAAAALQPRPRSTAAPLSSWARSSTTALDGMTVPTEA